MTLPSLPLILHTPVGDLSLQEFSSADVSKIALIERSLNQSPWSEKQLLDSVNSSHWCVGVKRENEWLAYAVFSFVAGESELLILGVDKKSQRKGIARNMLETLTPLIATRADTLFLEVRESNASAIALYDLLGFNQVGERLNYYPVPGSSFRETALLFAKELKEIA